MSKQDIQFKMNGVASGTPRNAKEMTLSANWATGEGQDGEEISTTSLEFVREDAKFLNEWVASGLTGGPGIFEGVPFEIIMNSQSLFEGFVDLTSESTFIECDEVIGKLVKAQSSDWLNDTADGFSFAYLRDQGFIIDSDYITIPYVLNYRPEALIVGQLLITSFLLTKEIIQGIKDTAGAIADLLNTIGFPIEIGAILAAAVKAAAQIIYTTAIIAALIITMKDLIEQFFPPVRRYRGMYYKRMFEVGLNYLGLSFSSTIFDDPRWSKAGFLPVKSKRGGLFGNTDEYGHPNQYSAFYNFGDFIRQMLILFNADYKITNGNFRFERNDYWNSTSNYVMDSVETNQSDRLSELEYNTGEFVKNYLVSLRTDIQDQNTLENFLGTNYQVISEPKTFIVKDNVIGKGLAAVRPPVARAFRKEELTESEQLLKNVCKLADSVVNLLGGSSNLASKITNRVGMMSLSSDTTSVDKMLFIDNEELDANQVTAKEIFEQWHMIESFAEVVDPRTGQTVHNQSIIQTTEKLKFCLNDWNELLDNNRFTTPDGREGEILSIDWSIFENVANIRYKIAQLYTKNIKLAFNEGE